jgi:hypothetical protein
VRFRDADGRMATICDFCPHTSRNTPASDRHSGWVINRTSLGDRCPECVHDADRRKALPAFWPADPGRRQGRPLTAFRKDTNA